MVVNLRNTYSFRLAYLTSINIKIEEKNVVTQHLHSYHDLVLSSNSTTIFSLQYNNEQSNQITVVKLAMLILATDIICPTEKNPGIQK